MVSLLYSRCIVTLLQTSDINLQIGEFGLFFDVDLLVFLLTLFIQAIIR